MSSGNDAYERAGESQPSTRPPAMTGLSWAVAVLVVLAELCRAGSDFVQMSSLANPAYLVSAWLPPALAGLAVSVASAVLLLRPGWARLGWGALATAVVTHATYQILWLLFLPFGGSKAPGRWVLPDAVSLALYVVALALLLHPRLREGLLHDAGRWSWEVAWGGLGWVTAHALLQTLLYSAAQSNAAVPPSLLHGLAVLPAGFAMAIHRRGGPWQITAALGALATILPLLRSVLAAQQLGTFSKLGPTIIGGLLAAAWTILLVYRSADSPVAAPHGSETGPAEPAPPGGVVQETAATGDDGSATAPEPSSDVRLQRRLLRTAAAVLILARTQALIMMVILAVAMGGGGGAVMAVIMFIPSAVVLIIVAIAWRARLALGWGAVMTHASASLLQWGALTVLTLTARVLDPRGGTSTDREGIFVIGLVIPTVSVLLLCFTRVVQVVRDGGATARTVMLRGAAVTALLHGLITFMLGGRTVPGNVDPFGFLGAVACLVLAGVIVAVPRPRRVLAFAVTGAGVAAAAGQLNIGADGAAMGSTFGVIPPGWSFIVIAGLAGWAWWRDTAERPATHRTPEVSEPVV
ncbi:hypothetical protein SAMN05421595_2176 [Austwickia chelonae]|uniref:Uncharacterized protein n=1 Tax=Austwickia chelonae NBRC 105200 TaxID=1184607 RepID=K6VK16_9MICO|nr:hypothetical protein [Austwickia chelonae]GAB77039.1 hypothetical protein AUCHE_04_00800 [Austwickia chelonae NBRC 105200]SEW33483.1 hypothetical protein SAMN05421595_2176 [Austwickia chelonae]